jgi:hypothetical protein
MGTHDVLTSPTVVRGYDAHWWRLRTAWSEYRHPSGHRVVLLGCIHVGSADYYERLNQILLDYVREGFVVHYERVQPPPAEKQDQATPEERDLLKRFKDSHQAFMGVVTETLGMYVQAPWHGMDDNWVNTDFDVLDLVRAHPEGAMERFIVTLDKVVTLLRTSPRWLLRVYRVAMLALVANMGPLMDLGDWAIAKSPELRREIAHEFIVDERNRFAMDATLAEPRPVVLPWGAGHYRGMAARLRVEGYELTSHTMIPMR